MTFKRSSRKAFNPATIGVNRGNALGRLSQAIGQTQSALNNTFLNLADNQLNELKKNEIKKGENLGKQAEIQYEDITFTDDQGNTRTQRITRGYKTPEDLINTSWASHAFDEQVAKTYIDAVVASADNILQTEKQLLKGRVRYDNTLPELNALYEENVNPGLDALRSTVPAQYQNLFDAKVLTKKNGARNELANRHHSKREAFFQADAQSKAGILDGQFYTRFINDADNLNDDLAELTGTMTAYAKQGNTYATWWIDNKLPSYVGLLTIGPKLAPFTNVDLENPESIGIGRQNLIAIREALNTGKENIVVINSDGQQEKVSFKSLGINKDILAANRSAINTTFGRQMELLTNAGVYARDTISVTNYLDSIHDSSTIPDKKMNAKIIAQLQNENSKVTEKLVSDFSVAMGRMDYTSDYVYDPANAAIKQQFQEFVANKYNVVDPALTQDLVKKLKNITANSVGVEPSELFGENGIYNSVGYKFMLSTISFDNEGKIVSSNLINKLGLTDQEKNQFYKMVDFENEYGAEKGAQKYLDFINSPYDNPLPKSNIAGQSIDKQISSHLLRQYSGRTGREDFIIGTAMINKIVERTKETYKKGPIRNLTDIADEIFLGMQENMELGTSRYMYIPAGVTLDPNEDTTASITQYPPDQFFVDYKGERSSVVDQIENTIANQLKIRMGTAMNNELSITKPVLGENIFMEIIGTPMDKSQVVYRFRYFDGEQYHYLLTDNNREYRLFYDQLESMTQLSDKRNIGEITKQSYFNRPMYNPENQPSTLRQGGKTTYMIDGKEISEEEYQKLK